MRTRMIGGATITLVASIFIGGQAQAAPRPNQITAECGEHTYTATAGSPMAVSARGVHDGRPFAMSVKAAEGYPAFNGVPRRLLTRCGVSINGEYLVDGYVLLTGPGAP